MSHLKKDYNEYFIQLLEGLSNFKRENTKRCPWHPLGVPLMFVEGKTAGWFHHWKSHFFKVWKQPYFTVLGHNLLRRQKNILKISEPLETNQLNRAMAVGISVLASNPFSRFIFSHSLPSLNFCCCCLLAWFGELFSLNYLPRIYLIFYGFINGELSFILLIKGYHSTC